MGDVWKMMLAHLYQRTETTIHVAAADLSDWNFVTLLRRPMHYYDVECSTNVSMSKFYYVFLVFTQSAQTYYGRLCS